VPVRAADFSLAASQTSSFEAVCELVAARAAMLPRPVLVGASFGALLAIALADRLAASGVVLINPLPPSPFVSSPCDGSEDAAQPGSGRRSWGLDARLPGTRRAIPELGGAEALYAFRRWRDFDARLLARARAGLALSRPASPLLCVISRGDVELPPADGLHLAAAWRAELIECEGSHVAPLLGPQAAVLARRALDWSRALAAR
jgi:pimeloyl-ACP methyl ester carboxylesterase